MRISIIPGPASYALLSNLLGRQGPDYLVTAIPVRFRPEAPLQALARTLRLRALWNRQAICGIADAQSGAELSSAGNSAHASVCEAYFSLPTVDLLPPGQMAICTHSRPIG